MISVIVSNFNGLRFLPRLLDSLRRQHDVETEFIVVDRHSSDGSVPFLESQPDIRLLSEPPESGLISGYAAGAAIARGELLFFCNEDMWFDPECLRNLARRIDLPNRIAAVDGWHWTYDGTEWLHGATRFRKSAWHLNSPYPFRAADFTVDLPGGSDTPFPCAGAFLIHRDVYAEIGGWDTSFFLDHEDLDLFLRAWQRQWRCVMAPDARVYHAVNASNGHILSTTGRPAGRRRYVGQRANLVIVAIKYFRWFSILAACAQWPLGVLNNLRAGHWESLKEDHAIPADILRRLSAAWAFRQANAPYNSRFTGEHFFTDPRFASALPGRVEETSPTLP
jgi:GT2 family glycosyltransferase